MTTAAERIDASRGRALPSSISLQPGESRGTDLAESISEIALRGGSHRMQCIFCKVPTDESAPVEHVIPSALGNSEHVLLRGTVCGKCNNYFGRKIEHPVITSSIFRALLSDMSVPNRRGRVPTVADGEEINLPEYRLMSRLIGKIGLEALAFRTQNVPNGNEEIVNHPNLDELRNYVRYNQGENWPFAYRALYPVNAVFVEDDSRYELLHEFDLLYTSSNEMYIVVAIFGVEFVLNLGGPVIDGYHQWQEEHDHQSHLYIPKA